MPLTPRRDLKTQASIACGCRRHWEDDSRTGRCGAGAGIDKGRRLAGRPCASERPGTCAPCRRDGDWPAAPSADVLPPCATAAQPRMLILFDSCEHLIEAIAICVDRILAEAPGVRILTTSREPLRIKGERVRRLLRTCDPPPSPLLSAEEALAFPAVQLFVDRATDGVEAFVLRIRTRRSPPKSAGNWMASRLRSNSRQRGSMLLASKACWRNSTIDSACFRGTGRARSDIER